MLTREHFLGACDTGSILSPIFAERKLQAPEFTVVNEECSNVLFCQKRPKAGLCHGLLAITRCVQQRDFPSDCRGQAIAEFVIIAITLFFTILGVIQLAMVLNAYSLVRYAAYNAARAGIVHSGSREKMQEAARLSLIATFPSHGRADHRLGFMENYLGARATDTNSLMGNLGEPITQVRIVNHQNLGCGEVVTFDDPAQAQDAIITVEVVHQYELVIPLVNRMIYWLYRKLELGGQYEGETLDYVAAVSHKERTTGSFADIEYRIPLVAHYTMRMQSDLVQEDCGPPSPPLPPPAHPPEPPPPPQPTPRPVPPRPTPTPTPTPVPPTPTPTPPPHCAANGTFCGSLAHFINCFPGQNPCWIPWESRVPSCNELCCREHCAPNCYSYTCHGITPGSPCYCNW